VLEAGLAELAEVGPQALSLEGVAKRAGVHKTTLYRRWGSREALLLDAIRNRAEVRVPIPDTGSIRTDLLELSRAAIANLLTPELQAIVRTAAALAPYHASVASIAEAFWSERLTVDGVIVERAIERGEIGQVDPETVIEAVLGPPYFRVLVSRRPVTDEFLRTTVDLVVAGLPAPEQVRRNLR
jgi:AcrR family transcriptional regulator